MMWDVPAPTTDDRPTWARRAGLPPHSSLAYVQALGTAVLVVLVGAYVSMRIIENPGRSIAALKKRAGV